MDIYICPACGSEHDEPGEAALGFRVLCLACVVIAGVTADVVAIRSDEPPLAA